MKIFPARRRAVGERLLLVLRGADAVADEVKQLADLDMRLLDCRAPPAITNGLSTPSPSSAVSPCLAADATMNPAGLACREHLSAGVQPSFGLGLLVTAGSHIVGPHGFRRWPG
jgi:hypothetical protein